MHDTALNFSDQTDTVFENQICYTSKIQEKDTRVTVSETIYPVVSNKHKLSNGNTKAQISEETANKTILRPVTGKLFNRQVTDSLRTDVWKQNGGIVHPTMKEEKQHPMQFRQWFVLVAGFVNYVLVAGFVFHLAIFYVEWLREFGQSNSKTACVQSVCMGTYMIGGFPSGLLIAKYGSRKCGMIGGMMTTCGLLMSYFASSIIYLALSLGISGLGGSLVFISSAAGVGWYFIGRVKILALAFITFGAGVGMMIFPIIAESLMAGVGWRGTLLIEAGLMLNVIPNSSLFTMPTYLKTSTTRYNVELDNKSSTPSVDNGDGQSISVISLHSELSTKSSVTGDHCHHPMNVFTILKELLIDMVFLLYAFTLAISIASFNFFLLFIMDYFRSKDIGRADAVTIYLYLTIGNTIFRLVSGFIKHIPHASSLIIPVFGTLCGFISITIFQFVGSSYYLNAILAFVYGCGFGCSVSAVVATTGKLVSQDAYSVGFGTSFTLMGIMVLIGGPVSGYIRDTTGNYDVLLYSVSVIFLLSSISFILIIVYRQCSKGNKQPEP